jgi:hypothetical protein
MSGSNISYQEMSRIAPGITPIVVGNIYKFKNVLLSIPTNYCIMLFPSFVDNNNNNNNYHICCNYSNDDGSTWDLAIGFYNRAVSVACSGNDIVAVLQTGDILHSIDGIRWNTYQNILPQGVSIYNDGNAGIQYSVKDDIFIIVDIYHTIYTSKNCINWETYTYTIPNFRFRTMYTMLVDTKGLLYIVGMNSDQDRIILASSKDYGKNWISVDILDTITIDGTIVPIIDDDHPLAICCLNGRVIFSINDRNDVGNKIYKLFPRI